MKKAMNDGRTSGSRSRGKQNALFYVSTKGRDAWSGTLPEPNAAKTDGPFASLATARNAVREWKKGKTLHAPITVMLRGGRYYLNDTFVLGPQDGGAPDSPVVYAAYPGEKPILSGGRPMAGWRPYKGKILQCPLPGAKGGKWKFRQLFFRGRRQIRARYPKFDPANPLYGGWAFIEGPADDGTMPAASFPGGYTNMGDRAFEGGSATAFQYKRGAFKHHWSKPSEGEVQIFPAFEGANDIIPIKAIDEEKRVITLQRELWQIDRTPWYRRVSFVPKNRFYVENLLEELTQPGEWCLDSEDGVLYFWPPTDSIAAGDVVAPALDCLVSIRGASWITICGLTFTETADGDDMQRDGLAGYGCMFPRQGLKYCGEAVHLRRAEHCRIEGNSFDAVGGNAVYLEGENLRNVLQRNEISQAGASGICVVGSMLQHPMFTQILDNHIHHCGVINKFVAGVFMGISEGTLVAHNSIHDMPHHGINLGSNGLGRNIVEYNEIRRTCMETHDTGAINCWMDISSVGILKEAQRCGHIIRYNLIADVLGCCVDKATGKIVTRTEGTLGIYLDDCSSNCFICGNIIVRVSRAIHVHLGKNNCIENNIAVDCGSLVGYGDSVSPRCGNAHMAGFMTGNRQCRNILYTSCPGAVLFVLAAWSDKQIELSDENLFFNTTGEGYRLMTYGRTAPPEKPLPLAEWQRMGYDAHSMIADPLFMDLEHDDFRLKPESPALALGFEPIRVSRIGIRADGRSHSE